MTECCFIKITEMCNRIFHLLFSTLKEKGGADPLRCGQLPVLCRRNVLSKQKQTHEKRKPLTCVWQNVLTWLCGTLINPRHPTIFHAPLLKLQITKKRYDFIFTDVVMWNHTTFHNRKPTPKQSGKMCQCFPNCSYTAILSLAKYSSTENPSLSIMQDHPHPPAI